MLRCGSPLRKKISPTEDLLERDGIRDEKGNNEFPYLITCCLRAMKKVHDIYQELSDSRSAWHLNARRDPMLM